MKKAFTAASSDGIHTLSGVVYEPEGEVRGLFHVVHGMTEHIGRYDPIMQDLAEAGYLCFGYDHLGHGKTVRDRSEWGYIAPKGGDDLLCRDVKAFSDEVKKAYGLEQAPYYLMGHSMGSFITRLAVQKYVRPDKYIIMGTGGKNPAAGAGLLATGLIKTFRGDRHVSDLLQKLAFGSYNSHFGGGTPEDPAPWLSKDAAMRKKSYADPACTFRFTVSAMGDLVRLNRDSNSARWYAEVPRDLPILLLSGAEDPVGDYGKGVRQVWQKLEKTGHNARCILYPTGRHEILNDDTYSQVKADILKFLEE